MTRQEKALRILQLALKINNTPTEREVTGDKPTVFILFSGHVDVLEVYIHSNGWVEEEYSDYRYYFRLYDDNKSVDYEMSECILLLRQIWRKYKPTQVEEVSANAV